ncbi:TRAP transporter small permease subunit [Pelagibius sp. Alg239-R121]|uniref:TRAP transporter small permease subunit n=1 Tax=Pelagibius sp. Alg239-R121 TaxID=2993448 RepID=UPI0024A613C7|nr:TRAP transporter small permease subunit [Pelagibius sp. Alg239-R121]
MLVILRSLVRGIEMITRWSGWLAAATAAPLMLAMVWEVVSRYAFNQPTFWAYELGYMLMGAGLMLGIAYAMQTRSHVRVDFLYGALPRRGQALVDLFGFVFLLPMVLWMTLGLWDYLVYAYVNNEVSGESAWNPVVWPFRVTFVTGFAFFALQTLAEIIKSAHTLFSGVQLDTRSDSDGARL